MCCGLSLDGFENGLAHLEKAEKLTSFREHSELGSPMK